MWAQTERQHTPQRLTEGVNNNTIVVLFIEIVVKIKNMEAKEGDPLCSPCWSVSN